MFEGRHAGLILAEAETAAQRLPSRSPHPRGLEASLSAAALLDNLKLFTEAVFLGDVDSLACHLASTAHSLISTEARIRSGIREGLIRLSVGIEHPQDLIADLREALAAAAAIDWPGINCDEEVLNN